MENVASECLPGPVKQVRRSIAKTIRAYRGNFRRLTDLVRTTVKFQTFKGIQTFLEAVHQKSLCSFNDINPSHDSSSSSFETNSNIIMQILRIRNRLDPDPACSKRLFGGYRDISLKIKMAFVCVRSGSNDNCIKFVPMNRWNDVGTKRLVFEIQIHHKDMQLGDNICEKEKHHSTYVQSRNVMSV
jgi:hypothetical protein